MALTSAQRVVMLSGSRPAWATGMDMAWDWTTNRSWTANPITDTHSADISGQYQVGLWSPFAANTLVQTDLGLQTVPTRTNSIRNNSNVGAVPGSPGTPPTNWTASAQTGYAWQLVATGTEFGLPYIDYRLSGTDASLRANNIIFDSGTAIVAATGETWSHSLFARVVAGSLTGVTTTLQMDENTSAGAFVTNGSSTITTTGSFARYSFTRTLSGGATVARVQPFLRLTTGAGATVDVTIRIYAPQMELGAFASAPILTTSGAATVNGNQQATSLGARAAAGVSGIVQFNLQNVGASGELMLAITDGTTDNRLMLRNTGGSLTLQQVAATASQGNPNVGAMSTGVQTVAFAAGPGFLRILRVGDVIDAGPVAIASYPTTMNTLGISGYGFTASNNMFNITRRLALRFGAQNASTFADLFAKATILNAVS